MSLFIDRVKNQVGFLAFHKTPRDIQFDLETLDRWCEPSFKTECRKLLEGEKNLFRYVERKYGVKPEIHEHRVFVIPDRCEFDLTVWSKPRLHIIDPELVDRKNWCGRHIARMVYRHSEEFPDQFIRAMQKILIDEGVIDEDSE